MALLDLVCAIGSPFDVRRFSVRESLSRLFVVEVFGVAEDPSLDLEAVVGKPASLELASGYTNVAGTSRVWSGLCNHIQQVRGVPPGVGGSRVLSTYFLRIVPTLWLLTQRRNYRIFQHLSIPDIVDRLLDGWAIPRQWSVARDRYPKLEIKVQYGETDHAFLSRLLEEAGITYVLAGESGGTALVFSDNLHGAPLRRLPAIVHEDVPTESAERPFVTNVRTSHEVRPGAHGILDFDFRNPAYRLDRYAQPAVSPEDMYEHVEYLPGAFLTEHGKPPGMLVGDDKGIARSDGAYGAERAERALVASRVGRRAVELETNVADLAPGVHFSLYNHPHEELEAPLMVTSMEMRGNHDDKWEMRAEAVFVADPYRPARVTPKPVVHGVQSATVVGPEGQEIHTDEFGRVRVQFPWDREGNSDENSSCWMRVSQGWAGIGYGMINVPRVGQEVLVGFLQGDPDQPLVVGRVFNEVHPVPYKLPEHKTVSGWRTSSSPANGGYNEIKLEDRAYKELVYVQAQRDLHTLAKRDEVTRVQRHHWRTVEEDQHLVVKKTKKELVELDDHLRVAGDRLQRIDRDTSLEVGQDRNERTGRDQALEVGRTLHVKAGDTLVLEAGARLTVKGPGGFIDIHDGGVDIVGTTVRINSGGSAADGQGVKLGRPEDADEAHPRDLPVE